MMIKITSELKTSSGFKTSIAVLEVTTFNVNETVFLVNAPTMPTPASGKTITINYQLYKSATDKTTGSASFQPLDFPYSIQLQPAADDAIDQTYIYTGLLGKLIDLGYSAELV